MMIEEDEQVMMEDGFGTDNHENMYKRVSHDKILIEVNVFGLQKIYRSGRFKGHGMNTGHGQPV